MSLPHRGVLTRSLSLLAASAVAATLGVTSASPAAGASSSGTSARPHTAYVVTISDPRASGDVSEATARNVTRSAAEYWRSESRGAITSFTVKRTRTLKISGSCKLDSQQLWARAQKLFPGVSFAEKGRHLVVFSPTGCKYPYGGMGNGGTLHSGGKVHMTSTRVTLVAHEIGHNLGLQHSNLETRSGSSVAVSEYYGLYGPMGVGMGAGFSPGALGASQRAYLGLPGESKATVALNTAKASVTTVTLGPTHGRTGKRAIRITDRKTGKVYYIEYRSGSGADARAYYTSASRFGPTVLRYRPVVYRSGMVVSRAKSNGSVDVLTVPRSGTWFSTLQKWQTFSGSGAPFTVKVVSLTSGAMKVRVTVKKSV